MIHKLITKKYLLTTFIVLLVLFFLYSDVAHGAQLYFEPAHLELLEGQEFQINLFIDTQGENINAVAGTLSYPSDKLDLIEIQEGGSTLNFWVEKPKERSEGKLNFAGITPGGFKGTGGFILSVFFQNEGFQNGTIELSDAAAHLNDGEGTETEVLLSDFQFSASLGEAEELQKEQVVDSKLPESFDLLITQDPNLYEGQYVLIFTAQDKQSGIDYYEIAEISSGIWHKFFAPEKNWVVIESPYLLSDQDLKSYIYVRAVDKTGNERIESLGPQNAKTQMNRQIIWLIIILVLLLFVVLLFFNHLTKKYKENFVKNDKK